MAKSIVITGAGAGLGRALARRFAKDGESVILLGRTLSKVETVARECGGGAFAVACDVADPGSVREAFATIAKRHPKIDVLINNAAVYEPHAVREASDEQIRAHILINLAGPIYCVRSALPLMGKGGQIINVSSESVSVQLRMLSLYQCSKAGLEQFTDDLRRELEADGIRVAVVRAGQMMDGDSTAKFDPVMARRFAEANAKAGINMRERPISNFASVTDAFRALIDLPPDLDVTDILLSARRP